MTRALLEQALSLSGYYESTWVGDLGDLEKLVQVAIETISAELAQSQGEPCTWTLDDELSETYASACGELWSFIEGGPIENRVRYCHHCGRPVKLGAPA